MDNFFFEDLLLFRKSLFQFEKKVCRAQGVEDEKGKQLKASTLLREVRASILNLREVLLNVEKYFCSEEFDLPEKDVDSSHNFANSDESDDEQTSKSPIPPSPVKTSGQGSLSKVPVVLLHRLEDTLPQKGNDKTPEGPTEDEEEEEQAVIQVPTIVDFIKEEVEIEDPFNSDCDYDPLDVDEQDWEDEESEFSIEPEPRTSSTFENEDAEPMQTLKECPVPGCGMKFSVQRNWRQHLSRRHPEEYKAIRAQRVQVPIEERGPLRECPVSGCHKKFYGQRNWRQHLSRIHPEEYKTIKSQQDQAFRISDATGPLQECPVAGCEKKFTCQKYCREHISRVHPEEYKDLRSLQNQTPCEETGPLRECPVEGCQKQFIGQRNWRQHLSRRHPEEYKVIQSQRKQIPFPGGIRCPIPTCERWLNGLHNWRTHIRRQHNSVYLKYPDITRLDFVPPEEEGWYRVSRVNDVQEDSLTGSRTDGDMDTTSEPSAGEQERIPCPFSECGKHLLGRACWLAHIRRQHRPEYLANPDIIWQDRTTHPIFQAKKVWAFLEDHKLEDGTYTCPDSSCSWVGTKKYLKQHLRKLHQDFLTSRGISMQEENERIVPLETDSGEGQTTPSLLCYFCGMSFSGTEKARYDAHLRRHTDEKKEDPECPRIPCPIPTCNVNLRGRNCWLAHIRRQHRAHYLANPKIIYEDGSSKPPSSQWAFLDPYKQEDETYTCPVLGCFETCTMRKQIIRHLKNVHLDFLSLQGIVINAEETRDRTGRKQRRGLDTSLFICYFCGDSYVGKKKQTFYEHLRSHTEEEPYECRFCGIRFKWDMSRKWHTDHAHKKKKRRESSDQDV